MPASKKQVGDSVKKEQDMEENSVPLIREAAPKTEKNELNKVKKEPQSNHCCLKCYKPFKDMKRHMAIHKKAMKPSGSKDVDEEPKKETKAEPNTLFYECRTEHNLHANAIPQVKKGISVEAVEPVFPPTGIFENMQVEIKPDLSNMVVAHPVVDAENMHDLNKEYFVQTAVDCQDADLQNSHIVSLPVLPIDHPRQLNNSVSPGESGDEDDDDCFLINGMNPFQKPPNVTGNVVGTEVSIASFVNERASLHSDELMIIWTNSLSDELVVAAKVNSDNCVLIIDDFYAMHLSEKQQIILRHSITISFTSVDMDENVTPWSVIAFNANRCPLELSNRRFSSALERDKMISAFSAAKGMRAEQLIIFNTLSGPRIVPVVFI